MTPRVLLQNMTSEAITRTPGLYGWAALHAARGAAGRRWLMVGSLCALAAALSALTRPAVSLAALSPALVYTAAACDVEPTSLATAHAVSAWAAGLLLPMANPVTVIVAQAFRLSFLRFTAWLVLPTLGTAEAPKREGSGRMNAAAGV